MHYSYRKDQLDYYHLWYLMHREEQINKMSKYYYDNKTEILKHKKIKYKQSKKNKNKNHG